MNKNNEYHMNIGGASIILLLIVFALTVFAALSVRASYHEMKLAVKTRESVEAFYQLDTSAENVKYDLQKKYNMHLKAGNSPETFEYTTATIKDGIAKYTVKDDNDNALRVTLRLNLDGTVNVLEWRAVEQEQGNYGPGGEDIGDIVFFD